MRILAINSLPNGSTGKIMLGIQQHAKGYGHTVISYYGNWKKASDFRIKNAKVFGYKFENIIHAIIGKYTGLTGKLSIFGTLDLIIKIVKFKPDIIHLHNVHLWVICYPLLLGYLSRLQIPIVWTLHDCWSFTGLCPYFSLVDCKKWIKGCHSCPQLSRYPFSKIDVTNRNWKIKKYIYQHLKNVTFVTPSDWLADLAKKSMIKNHRIVTINNGIDLNIFHPYLSDIKKKYGISPKSFLILGVAFGWERRKGLDVFLKLREKLKDDDYSIILVGTDSNIDKILPKGIVSINKTNNQEELAKLYSAADVFLNPTREENYPTVNMESVACGTPVITFNTGGSPEMLDDKTGIVVNDNIDDIYYIIKYLKENKCFIQSDCIEKAKDYDMKKRFDDYINLYESVINIQ